MITINDITNRLKSFGYVEGNDTFALNFLIKKVENHIKHECNIDDVPDGLSQVWIDLVCGEFLAEKKATGQLTDLQIEAVVKKIQDGDTTVEYSATTDANVIFDKFINNLLNSYQSDFGRYRKLVW